MQVLVRGRLLVTAQQLLTLVEGSAALSWLDMIMHLSIVMRIIYLPWTLVIQVTAYILFHIGILLICSPEPKLTQSWIGITQICVVVQQPL
jgi:hypothetical protein